MEKDTFRVRKNGREVRLEVISDHRWRVVSASKTTGFQHGDEVTPVRIMTWQMAKRRVNSCRSALSPNGLVLLTGKGFERSEEEIRDVLEFRPWEPDSPKRA